MKDVLTIVSILQECFPKGKLINNGKEFLAHPVGNEYFILENCETEMDVKCKVLEWFSRPAFKTEPYESDRKNEEFHDYFRTGINLYLGQDFSEDDIALIYTKLGNACNHKKTIEFIDSDYNMSLLS